MGKKNKKQKEELAMKDPEKVEDSDKVSIKKTFRDTGIIMGVIAAIVGILIFATKDATYIEGEEGGKDHVDDDIVGDPEVAYENLVSFANRELISVRGLNSSLTYVKSLVSLEFFNGKVVYCGLGNEVDGYNYLVKVSIGYSFADEDEFIYKMTTLNLSTAASTYGVTAEAMEINNDENVREKLFDKLEETLPKYDIDKQYSFCVYNTTDGIFIAGTYGGKDGSIYSTNEMRYNDSLDEYTITSEYGINPSKNVKMYSLLEAIIV